MVNVKYSTILKKIFTVFLILTHLYSVTTNLVHSSVKICDKTSDVVPSEDWSYESPVNGAFCY